MADNGVGGGVAGHSFGRWCLAVCLLFLGGSKLVVAPQSVSVLPSWLVVAFAVVELALGMLLILMPRHRRGICFAVLLISIGTAGGAASISLLGYDITGCGCFGAWRATLSQHLVVSFGLSLLSSGLLFSRERMVSPSGAV